MLSFKKQLAEQTEPKEPVKEGEEAKQAQSEDQSVVAIKGFVVPQFNFKDYFHIKKEYD